MLKFFHQLYFLFLSFFLLGHDSPLEMLRLAWHVSRMLIAGLSQP